jgi:biotin carboxylase
MCGVFVALPLSLQTVMWLLCLLLFLSACRLSCGCCVCCSSSQPADCHVVAVRITAEDANDGFKPTCGHIDEVHFRPTPEVWGYFSVKSGGGIHEYSDSQVSFQSAGEANMSLWNPQSVAYMCGCNKRNM